MNDPKTASARQLASLIRQRQLSSTELTEFYIRRIQEVNPRINAVVTPCFDRALQEAREADAALARGDVKGPLHGVPMTIKDSIDTEGVVSTGGTQGRSHFVPEKDATVVRRLRQAGAILLGKTNTPEFTLGGVAGLGTTSNILFGMTRNPYDTRYSVYGSSGGAGAIIAAGGTAFDIGSDFGGSIRSPSHACGIAGIKPTTGRVSRNGHIVDYGGVFDSWQQLGPMARHVEDLVHILPVIAGPDHLDAALQDIPLGDPGSVVIGDLRVAWYTHQGAGSVGASTEVREIIQRAARALEEAGCRVEERVPPRQMEATELRMKMTRADGNQWQKRLTDKYGTIVPGPSRRFDYPPMAPADFYALLEQQDSIRTDMLQFMESHDILLCPVRATPVPLIGDPDDWTTLSGASFTGIFNLTGYPAGVVRGGASANSVPIGVQVVAGPWRDDRVLAVMAHLEKALGGFVPPGI
jgi:amidase